MIAVRPATTNVLDLCPTVAAKLNECRKGGVSLNDSAKRTISDEFGRMNGHQYRAIWNEVGDADRDRLIWMVAVSCGPEITSMLVTDWLAERATAEARRQVEFQLAEQIEAAAADRAEAQAALAEARAIEAKALVERKEALALLSEARHVRANADAEAEILSLREELRDCKRRLNAITAALC